jgi:hypothetical protein
MGRSRFLSVPAYPLRRRSGVAPTAQQQHPGRAAAHFCGGPPPPPPCPTGGACIIHRMLRPQCADSPQELTHTCDQARPCGPSASRVVCRCYASVRQGKPVAPQVHTSRVSGRHSVDQYLSGTSPCNGPRISSNPTRVMHMHLSLVSARTPAKRTWLLSNARSPK